MGIITGPLSFRPFAAFRKLLCLVLLSSVCSYAQSRPEKEDITAWVKDHFAKGKTPPFSFTYGNKASASFIRKWSYQSEQVQSKEPDVDEYLFTYKEPKGGLVVKCYVTGYRDFSAVKWVLKFSNTSSGNSPSLEKAQVINHDFTAASKGDFVLHHAKGSNAKADDFAPLLDTLGTGGKIIRMSPNGARGSSDGKAFPFFNIEKPDHSGMVVAIGWTGKWYAEIGQKSENTLSLQAGMERMKLALHPREEIRTPSVCLLFWKGTDRMVGHNQFRKFVLAHHSRKINGKFAELPLASGISRGGPSPCNEFTCLTESYALATIERFKQFDIVPEVCWIDAGWFPGGAEWWEGVGNWFVDKTRFPNGFRPIADAVHKAGSKFLVWFEPERARKGTQLATEHPEWMLHGDQTKKKSRFVQDSYLLDLGNTQARLWLTDHVSNFLKNEGVDYYRQDFNGVDAEECWLVKDEPDRTGISEIRHIEGLYAFWDSLLVRFPNLIIDNCASGGRRIDLETISRSSPLWRSDYGYGEPDGYQNHTYGLNFYLPLHGTGLFNSSVYDFRSSMSSSMVMFWDIHSASSSIPKMKKCIADFKRLRPFYYGDYYPLSGANGLTTDHMWLAYQLNRPEQGDGMVMAFRRKNAAGESFDVKLRGVNGTSEYELQDEDSGVKMIKSGKDLMAGIRLVSSQKQGSILLVYKVLK
jgi:alpha-galactosidase